MPKNVLKWDEKEIALRLESSKTAQERTRLAFFANSIIPCVAPRYHHVWNGYLSIYSDFAQRHFADSDQLPSDA